jgi:hypothetical protein|tara:strand:+ start:2613 stop:3104 length:492 start_codon:yes stop_codon:yes gene_type:complete
MSKLKYKSESREWYLVSSLIIFIALICYFIVAWYALPDQSEFFPLLTMAIELSFLLLGLSGVFLGLQGYNFRNNDAILVRLEGEEVALQIESLYLKKNIEIKSRESSNLIDMGLWRPIKLFSLENGQIEIKEMWISAFFYRTQVAFRGEVPKEIIEDYLANLV